MIIRDFAPCKKKLVSLDYMNDGQGVGKFRGRRTIPKAMVSALLLGAPGTLKKTLITKTPIAARASIIWMMCTGNL